MASLPLTTTYVAHAALIDHFAVVAKACGGRAHVFSLGDSVQGRPLIGVFLTAASAAGAANDDALTARTRPAVKLVGNMHGDEVVGRALLINLVEYLCGANGGDDDPRVQRIRDHIDVFIVPSMNPDDFEISRESGVHNHVRAPSRASQQALARA